MLNQCQKETERDLLESVVNLKVQIPSSYLEDPIRKPLVQ